MNVIGTPIIAANIYAISLFNPIILNTTITTIFWIIKFGIYDINNSDIYPNIMYYLFFNIPSFKNINFLL